MSVLGYEEWRKFVGVIKRAEEACKSSGQYGEHHFVGADKMIKIAVGSPKETCRRIGDYKLSRYACYLIAQNGDPRKKEIATAQTYFTIQTRRQETYQQLSPSEQRLFLRGEGKATFAHIVVGQQVRKSIKEIGGTMLEDLPSEPHIRKLKRLQNKSLKSLKEGKGENAY